MAKEEEVLDLHKTDLAFPVKFPKVVMLGDYRGNRIEKEPSEFGTYEFNVRKRSIFVRLSGSGVAFIVAPAEEEGKMDIVGHAVDANALAQYLERERDELLAADQDFGSASFPRRQFSRKVKWLNGHNSVHSDEGPTGKNGI